MIDEVNWADILKALDGNDRQVPKAFAELIRSSVREVIYNIFCTQETGDLISAAIKSAVSEHLKQKDA